jgi:hypothetical protein
METITIAENGTIYRTVSFNIKNTKYNVMIVSGKYNYVNVSKVSVLRNLGKDFKNFDEATKAYKNPQIKIELLKIEMGLN